MANEQDEMNYEILADGTIKFTTDSVSPANHSSAEQFLRMVASLLGGETTRIRRTDTHHTHEHTHAEHKHEHEEQ